MSEMIERVARAIDHSLVNRLEYPGEPSHSDILDAARAAIEAMREPTEAMCEAGFAEACKHDCGESAPALEIAPATFTAMIDASLKDTA